MIARTKRRFTYLLPPKRLHLQSRKTRQNLSRLLRCYSTLQNPLSKQRRRRARGRSNHLTKRCLLWKVHLLRLMPQRNRRRSLSQSLLEVMKRVKCSPLLWKRRNLNMFLPSVPVPLRMVNPLGKPIRFLKRGKRLPPLPALKGQ